MGAYLFEDPADCALGIVEVPKNAGASNAGCDTRGLPPLPNPVFTEGAFVRVSFLGVHIAGIVRACGNASFAADALVSIDLNSSILALVGSSGGTIVHTRRIVAVVAKL